MTVPEYPDSRQILLEDKPLFDKIFMSKQPEVSTYTFTNLFAWREPYKTGISRIGESIIVHHNLENRVCLEPMGGDDIKPIVAEVLARSQGLEICFERISSEVSALFVDDPGFIVEPDRENSDYVYLASDLINLHGRKFDGKRNHVNRFKSLYKYEYEKITEQTAIECLEFTDRWCEERSCRKTKGMRMEQLAMHQMLENFDSLKICGGAIRIDGVIAAFSLGEALNPETLVVHAEKADQKIEGLYQLINNEFCIHEANNYEYVNREQDLGIPGLRKAKKSYHPVKMIDTYTMRRAASSI